MTTAKFRCQTKNQNQQQMPTAKITTKQHHEATHQATQPKTAYNTQTEQPIISINVEQKQKQNHEATHKEN